MLVIIRNKGPIFEGFQGWDTLFIFDNILFTQFIVKHVNRAGKWDKSKNTCIVDIRRTDKNGIPERPETGDIFDLLNESLPKIVISGPGDYKFPIPSDFKTYLKGLEFEDKGGSRIPRPIDNIFDFKLQVNLDLKNNFNEIIEYLKIYKEFCENELKEAYEEELKKNPDFIKTQIDNLNIKLKKDIEEIENERKATTAIRQRISNKIKDLKSTKKIYEDMVAKNKKTETEIAAINESVEQLEKDLKLEEEKLNLLNNNKIYVCSHIMPCKS